MSGRRSAVLYFGWKRDRWRPLLRAIPEIELLEVDLRIREGSVAARLGRIATAIRLAASRPVDLILSESIGVESTIALLLRRLAGAPLAVRLKGDPWQEAAERGGGLSPGARLARRLNLAAATLMLGSADAVLPISPPLAERARRELGGTVRGVIPNQVSSGEVAPLRDGLPELLTVTNFEFAEKIEPLEPAAAALAPLLEELGLRWTIVGGGRHLEPFRRRIASVSPRIDLPGFVPVADRYRRRPILVYWSGLDALPTVLLEASVAGLPILVNRGGPVDWFCEDGVDGFVCSAAELPGRIRRLVDEPALRRRLGETARARAEERYGAEAVSRAVLAEIFRLSAASPPRASA